MAQISRKSTIRKDKSSLRNGVVHIQSTFNNTIITITNINGDTVSWASAGSSGFKGARKSTPFAAQTAAEKAALEASNIGIKSVDILVKGQGSGRETAIRAIEGAGLEITSIQDITSVPHNGCRPPKRRRVYSLVLKNQMINNISIKCLKSDKIESGACHGQFLINSLRSGQGITIGNQLRRVLLNDLGGMAITAIRIAGVSHEFSTIPGVREDILEILLNLKGVVLRSNTQSPQFGRLKIQGPIVVTADLIQLPSNLELVNPNHYLMTISTANVIEIEFKFEYGMGYKLASQTFLEEDENYLQLDTIFMPVQKVDFKIENVYDNANNITERLFLDIWTNGSISPNEALKSAAQVTIDLFSLLVEEKQTTKINKLKPEIQSISIEPYTNIAIEELQLSVRAYNCLKKAQINTVGDLLQYSPEKLQELKNFGRKSSIEVFSTLKNKLGIILK